MKVLITGGAGYIGSTIASALLDAGMTPIILDSLVTGRKEFTEGRHFYQGDIADAQIVRQIFSEHPEIDITIHCAALIVVPDSVVAPAKYYKENVTKSLAFFETLVSLGKCNVVFSSSASLYGSSDGSMVTEESFIEPLSPYAKTKWMMEMVLQDFCKAYQCKAVALRYFNPIGADFKMRSGIHDAKPTHVLGKMVDATLGKIDTFVVTGTGWNTRDGTGIRDYVHVWDLALAHVKAVQNFTKCVNSDVANNGYTVINLGTGRGVTVKELLSTFQSTYGQLVPVTYADARPGDVAGAFANADRAKNLLDWTAVSTLETAIQSALRWGAMRDGILILR